MSKGRPLPVGARLARPASGAARPLDRCPGTVQSQSPGGTVTAKIILEWAELENGARALVFDADTWAQFEKAAQTQGKSAHQLISTAVAGSLGTVTMDSYSLNRWLKNDDPDFFRQ